ncbi:tetratricopeptide repeat protein [Aliikangiella sp. G2MR2-5]|uniref:tetratricopeptide repeat protein n=1 Tax=Aliikangiella sp. G2MR2-5 TaxID=2788943 RepID=UPI0018ABF8EC|nr:tetratricopeptide repeat protein [Aliikangiella sp. G2MR2-5]
MPIFILGILIQVAFVIHVVKTGRSTTWIWIIVMLPLAGSIAYFLLEVLPNLSRSRTGRSATKKIVNTLNPNKSINQATDNFEVADTVDNSMRLADELMTKGMFKEALELYQRCLKGIHKTDPYIMSRCARAQFETGDYNGSKKMLDGLIEANPDFKDADCHLLYARSLEKLGDTDGATKEYEVLVDYTTSPESAYHYAMMSRELGQSQKAKELLSILVKKSATQGKHYQSLHGEWIKKSKNTLKELV